MGQNQGSKLHVPAYVTFRFFVVKSVVCGDTFSWCENCFVAILTSSL
jgi:hypothetical protein